MEVIKVSCVTKDYGNHKGIFDVNLKVNQGEVYGFLGPNGAGKTTTIRNLMGFIRPNQGELEILSMPCFEQAADIQKKLGYLPGEIAFPEGMTGMGLLNFLAQMKGIRDTSRMKELIAYFELNPIGKIKKMSKGMKQKIGIVNAFMGSPEILILDEPTSGLDPLMQNRFVDLVLAEKKRGTTIFMSSHSFEEIEKTCDRTAIIREGKIVAVEDMEGLKNKKTKNYVIRMATRQDAENMVLPGYTIVKREKEKVTVAVKTNVQEFLKLISAYPVKDMEIQTQTLEEIFLHYYGEEVQ